MKHCAQCELPVSEQQCIERTVHGETLPFCCSGCSFTYSITGEKGEEGISMLYLGKMVLGGFFAMNVMTLSFLTYSAEFTNSLKKAGLHDLNNWAQLVLTIPVLLILGLPYLRSAVQNRRFNTDTLVAIGTFVAFFFSIYQIFIHGKVYFDTACIILFLVTIGRLLESAAKARASKLLEKLQIKLPQTLIKLEHDQEHEVTIKEVKVGDVLKIKSGERIPADGIVLWDAVAINEAMFTGESKWVHKSPYQKVYAGTSVADGILTLQVQSLGDETALAHIQRLAQTAKLRDTRIQKLVDNIAQYFTPIILILAALCFVLWSWQGTMIQGFEHALALLIVACPCALGLATPMAQYLALSKTAELGIIVRDLDVVDKLHLAKKIYYDKTGTITEGKFSISKEVWFEDKFTHLPLLLALEKNSNHPLAKAILQKYQSETLNKVSLNQIQVLSGKGIVAQCEGHSLICGRASLLEEYGITPLVLPPEIPKHATLVYFAKNQTLIAILAFEDKIREDFRDFQEIIHDHQIEEIILSGDHEQAVQVVARPLGITQTYSNLLPEDKLRILQQDTQCHIMLADGINDAPALAEAEIGIAVAKAEDIAKQSADIILLGDLGQLGELMRLAKYVRRIVRSNLFWAFFYNCIAVILALFGYINPMISAIAMVLSSLIVVVNSNRIYHWE